MGRSGAFSHGQAGMQGVWHSQTCYPYKAKLDAENDLIADWLVRLTNNQRNWGFGLCFLYLRNVKRLQMEPQARLQDLPCARAEPAD